MATGQPDQWFSMPPIQSEPRRPFKFPSQVSNKDLMPHCLDWMRYTLADFMGIPTVELPNDFLTGRTTLAEWLIKQPCIPLTLTELQTYHRRSLWVAVASHALMAEVGACMVPLHQTERYFLAVEYDDIAKAVKSFADDVPEGRMRPRFHQPRAVKRINQHVKLIKERLELWRMWINPPKARTLNYSSTSAIPPRDAAYPIASGPPSVSVESLANFFRNQIPPFAPKVTVDPSSVVPNSFATSLVEPLQSPRVQQAVKMIEPDTAQLAPPYRNFRDHLDTAVVYDANPRVEPSARDNMSESESIDVRMPGGRMFDNKRTTVACERARDGVERVFEDIQNYPGGCIFCIFNNKHNTEAHERVRDNVERAFEDIQDYPGGRIFNNKCTTEAIISASQQARDDMKRVFGDVQDYPGGRMFNNKRPTEAIVSASQQARDDMERVFEDIQDYLNASGTAEKSITINQMSNESKSSTTAASGDVVDPEAFNLSAPGGYEFNNKRTSKPHLITSQHPRVDRKRMLEQLEKYLAADVNAERSNLINQTSNKRKSTGTEESEGSSGLWEPSEKRRRYWQ